MGNSLLSSRLFPLLTIVGLAIIGVYALFDPAQAWWMPKCPVHLLTGLDCPGCGSQRAVHALFRGDFRGAIGYNALLVFMIPFLLLMGYAEFTRRRHGRLYRFISHPAVIYTVMGIVIAWTIIRNLL